MGAVDKVHVTVSCRDDGGTRLEDEDSVWVALGVESKRPGHRERGWRFVDARQQRCPTHVRRPCVRLRRCSTSRVVVGDRQVGLGPARHGVVIVDCAVDHSGWKTSNGGCRAGAEVPVEDGRTGIRDTAPGQHGEAGCRSKSHWRFGRIGRSREYGPCQNEHNANAE